MKVIFGIGNPGDKYELTRHNAGFQVIDRLVALSKSRLKLQKNWFHGTAEEQGVSYHLVKPLSYVNESGVVARQLMETLETSLPEFLVVVDDFSLPLGTTRMRAKGSGGGHKGLESLIYHLESLEFPRLRIGIGPKVGESIDFVLSEFTKKELEVLDEAIEHAVLSVHTFVSEGIDRAIEVCNTGHVAE